MGRIVDNMSVCNICGSDYSFWKKACPDCAKAIAVVPPSQIQLTNVEPVSFIIHQLQTGQHTSIPSNINLHKGEVVLFTTQVTLAEDRKSSKRVGSSAGVSVSVGPVGHGIRIRSGSNHSHTTSTTQLIKV